MDVDPSTHQTGTKRSHVRQYDTWKISLYRSLDCLELQTKDRSRRENGLKHSKHEDKAPAANLLLAVVRPTMVWLRALMIVSIFCASVEGASISGQGGDFNQIMFFFPIEVPTSVTSVHSIVISGLSHPRSENLDVLLRSPDGIMFAVIDIQQGFNESYVDNTYTIVDAGSDADEWPPSGVPPDGQYQQYFGTRSMFIEYVPFSAISGSAGTWQLAMLNFPQYNLGTLEGWTLKYNEESPSACSASEMAACDDQWASCSKATGRAVCACFIGFTDVNGNGTKCADINECLDEDFTSACDRFAFCENKPGKAECVCPEGFIGDGSSCTNDAFSVRTVLKIPGVGDYTSSQLTSLKISYARIVTNDSRLAVNSSILETMFAITGTAHYGDRLLGVTENADADDQITLFALFETETEATDAFNALSDTIDWSPMAEMVTAEEGPQVYRWIGGSTSDELEIPPTGLSVDSVRFDPTCLSSGCWKVDVTYTKGSDDFNVFFLPRADSSDATSYDPVYSTADTTWLVSPADTFLPANHPCTSMDYDPSSGDLPAAVTACCIPEFLAMYRPVAAFTTAVTATGAEISSSVCGTGDRSRAVARSAVPWFTKSGQTTADSNAFPSPVSSSVVSGVFVDGVFDNMTSNIYHQEVQEAFVGVYKATLELDEVELRTLAGQRRGTVGVEHSVDTFVGVVNFSPTGSKVLDTGAVQVALHLETTSFFTVSTHGTNDYTFLEYVNLRLVAIYGEDNDFSGTGESDAATVRTVATGAAHYLQVTFTLGAKYEVNENSGLIPLASVRAGEGTFFDDAAMAHKCREYTDPEGNTASAFDGDAAKITAFDVLLNQSCAPAAGMCSSPASIPDSFVSFNIPLGVDFFDPPSDTLSNSVFVDMVISAVDIEARGDNPDPTDPNAGEAPWQMKTTLTASIPVVEGGVNIFCDGFTAKTDLKDVANVDIVVGTASSSDGLTRLRIKEDIASTQLSPSSITQIDSDSIEAGLMTLVLKGEDSYFESNTGRREVTVELEDVITIHIMESDGEGSDADVASSVMGLITSVPADNSDSNGLITDGYALNGAFYFTIDRSAQRAHLEPSDGLLALCPFNPPRPANSMLLETCVTRRDVRYRGYPHRSGGHSTAMEICTSNAEGEGAGSSIAAGSCDSATTSSVEASFMVSVLGDSTYARNLAAAYAGVISDRYDLNGRYRRAYWINPGYEWTPTQTGGTPLFSVSQKLYMFALVTLDEGLATGDDGESGATPSLPTLSRRRMLLQSTPDETLQDGQSSLGAEALEFHTSATSMMAKAFEVPEDRVATFRVTLQLTSAEACMTTTELQASVRETLDDYMSEAASDLYTVQVTSMAVDKAGVHCSRRSVRVLLSSYSEASAEVTMLVVFQDGTAATISLAKLQTMQGIASVEPLSVSPKVNTEADQSYVPPPSSSKHDGSSSNVGLVAGAAAGGAVAAAGVAAGVVMYMRSKERSWERDVASVVQTINVEDLKQQLSADV